MYGERMTIAIVRTHRGYCEEVESPSGNEEGKVKFIHNQHQPTQCSLMHGKRELTLDQSCED
jgi:hypothetical protein